MSRQFRMWPLQISAQFDETSPLPKVFLPSPEFNNFRNPAKFEGNNTKSSKLQNSKEMHQKQQTDMRAWANFSKYLRVLANL